MKTVNELMAFSSKCAPGKCVFGDCSYADEELRALANCLVTLRKNSCIVEIGTFAGRSASLYFQLQKDLNLDIHLIDNWIFDPTFAMATFTKMVVDNFIDVPFNYHKMESNRVARNFLINFLHVDGGHNQEEVEGDCALFLPYVVPGGIVAFHDVPHPPVEEAIRKFVKPSYALVEAVGRMQAWRKP